MRNLFFAAALLAGAAFTNGSAFAQDMDCDAQFDEATAMLGDHQDAAAAMKAEALQMALDAYEMCQAGDEDDSKSLFDEVFNRFDGM